MACVAIGAGDEFDGVSHLDHRRCTTDTYSQSSGWAPKAMMRSLRSSQMRE